jgi:Phytanoyl-CoA dioxygenase (PhyH)
MGLVEKLRRPGARDRGLRGGPVSAPPAHHHALSRTPFSAPLEGGAARDALASRHAAGQAALDRNGAGYAAPTVRALADLEPANRHDRAFPPDLALSDLDANRLRAALQLDGCVKAPGLLTAPVVSELVNGIDRAFSGFDQWLDELQAGVALEACATSEWFEPFQAEAGGSVLCTRPWARQGGAIFAADSPRVATRWFDLIREIGLFDLVADYLGEAPITTLDKCALRRIGRNDGVGVEWHQDGSFLGEASAINVWLCLSDTTESPGLDVVSRRLDSVVETGTGGAGADWTVGPQVVAQLAETTPVVQPVFAPGDALIFDELLLHRTTQPEPPLPEMRYAIETWFFRASAFPDHQQIPLAL